MLVEPNKASTFSSRGFAISQKFSKPGYNLQIGTENQFILDFGLDKVKMDFAFFAIAFNLKKMCSAIDRKGKIGDNTPLYNLLLCLFMAFGLQTNFNKKLSL